MAKLKFKDENDNFISVVQDVKVNGDSVFDGKDADIKLKTINNESIVGTGNIDISSGGTTDVQINGTSITSNNVADIITESAYNASTNKIATKADIPTDTSDLTNSAGYITGITSSDVTTALGYTPYNSSNPNGYTSNVGTVTSVNNETPDSNGNVNISIPTNTSDLNNDSGFITGINSTDVTTALGYVPYDSSNPDGYTSNVGTVTSVNNTSPDGNGNVTISIPTKVSDLNNDSGFITGISSTDVTTALGYTPYNSSNPSGYQTASDVSTAISGKQDTIDSSHKLSADLVDDSSTTNKFVTASDKTTWSGKQDELVSGTNIKTVNNTSLLGSGNVSVQETLVSGTNIKTVNSNSLLGSGNIDVQETLVSGSNIKTVNSNSLLGSGDIAVQEPLVSGTNIKTVNSTSLLGSGNISVQEPLVSGTTIKTVNSNSLLGSGDVTVQETLVSGTNIKTINNQSLLGSGNITISSGGTATDVQINGTSITSNNVANILTETAYNETTNKIATVADLPTVPTNISSFNNDSGYITGITGSDVTTALGYIPYNSSNPNGYTSNVGTVTSVNNTSPDSNGNVAITIPTVPTNVSAFNNDAGYTTNTGTVTSVQIQAGTGLTSSTSTAQTTTLNTTIGIDSGYKLPTTIEWGNKQDTLVSGTNIKTINSTSLLGSGNIAVQSVIDSSHKLSADNVDDTSTTNKFVTASDKTTWNGKQDALVSGTNIKTINNQSILGSGNLNIARNIGEIVASTIPLTDAELHLLDGSLISGSGSYADFVTYISGLVSTYPDLFETEANWQTAVTTYGVCGKFVYDSVNNTVRLPKITGITEGTNTISSLGDLTEAGLPNITGEFGSQANGGYRWTYMDIHTGAFSTTESKTTTHFLSTSNGSSTGTDWGATFDASASNSIYGNSNTVQPQTIKVLYYIVMATSTKTAIEVDIDEVATDLNGKVDLDGTNATFAHITETYVNGSSWYRVYSDGWCEQGGTYANLANDGAVNVLFLQPYVDTNYSLQLGYINSGASTQAWTISIGAYSPSTTGFTTKANLTYWTSIKWYACGYIR